MTRRIALLTTLLALALAAPVRAQDNAFGPLPPADTPVPTVTATSSTTDDGSTSKKVLFLIGGALIIGFGAMGYLIMRDARAAIPDDELGPRLRDQGPHKHKQQAKAKARAKTRQQKAARKVQRNR
jgi:hypothetical protein